MTTYAPIPECPEFSRWYALYPRKQCKGDARKAWEQTKAIRPPVEQMLKALAVQRHQHQWQKENGIWVPLPATYLRREQWDDVVQVEVDRVKDGKAWHETVQGIEARGLELGIQWNVREETFQQFTMRVRRAAERENVVPIRMAV